MSMADFRLWATINYVPPDGYVVAVSAVPDEPGNATGTLVEVAVKPSHEEALQIRDQLMLQMGERVRARGDRVVDVEAD